MAKKRKVPLVRTSERSTFKTCRWQWNKNYVERLRTKETAPALVFGTLVHEALEARYPKGIRRGPHPAKVFEKLYERQVDLVDREWGINVRADDAWADMLELGVDMLEGYVEKYGKDEEWQVIGSEVTFKVPVLKPGSKKILFHYVGTIDSVWKNRSTGNIWLNDYKTTANDPMKEAQGKGALDEQATAYWTWGTDYLLKRGILKSKDIDALSGMLYTFLRKSFGDPRPTNDAGQSLNQDGSVSKKQPIPRFHRETIYRTEIERENARERVLQEFAEMEMVRSGDLAPYKNPQTGKMGHCNWCQFRDICELHEAGADWEEYEKITTEKWNPYSDHEIATEGKSK